MTVPTLTPAEQQVLELLLGGASNGKVLYYDQNVDPEEGSIVSHAGIAFVE